MKKLLYIFTLALLVVACDKYDDQFAESVSIAEEVKEIDAIIAPDFLAAKATLEAMMGVATPIKGERPVSARKSGNVLRLVIWNTSGNASYEDGLYAHVTSEDYDACYDSYSPSYDATFDWDTNSNELTITISDVDQVIPITGDLQATYDTDFGNALYYLAQVANNSGVYSVSGAQPAQVPAP